ncbi:ionotropic receptor 40a [Planococcus citri]|uniref:ionotropic receptor 40a n=1 Tax=Planococcus citri TaxID=170843 RepID=UPI0031F9FFE0
MQKIPLFKSPSEVYGSFHGRIFVIPVLHKPPWFFVNYHNETTIEVEGGRDDKLISFVANKLNFRCEYIDPPDRNQGSSVINGTMQGALGLVASREADFFIGDLTVTYERSQAVEFSFLTLVDSELFLTHSPGLLNEALALIRPFHWIVWPALLITLLISGPVLFLFVMASNSQNHRHEKKTKVFGDCVWITFTIFLQQAIRFKSNNQKVRFIFILFSLSLTYVIGDMYSANLTSLFARPSREHSISTLEELIEAMTNDQYQLLVEENSASHANLENGTGMYKTIWSLMTKQRKYFIESTEAGMNLIRDRKKYAIIGGRETFYYDTHRFGAENFHLSQKLSTRYSAIAFQIGCPYLDIFNTVLMRLFEGGIYSKITEEEYQKLRQKQAGATDNKIVSEGANGIEENENRLKAMSMKTLQGAFYILIIGYILSALNMCLALQLKQQIPRRRKKPPTVLYTALFAAE